MKPTQSKSARVLETQPVTDLPPSGPTRPRPRRAPSPRPRPRTRTSTAAGIGQHSALDSDLPAGTRIDQYEIIRLVGRGGMGSVHLARDLRLGRRVAIKFLANDGVEVDQRFLAEARATARCQHPNIVIIHDVGAFKKRPYMVLEYIEGQTLGDWLMAQTGAVDALPAQRPRTLEDRRTPLPAARALKVMIPVARALARAHAMGIVHRDLKPANIMIDHTGVVKVLDFGIATLRADAGLHDSRADEAVLGLANHKLIGTLPYMSPEQLNGEPATPQSDIWAVGIMLFEMVVGEHPVPSLSPADLFDIADRQTSMPRVAERCHDVGPLAEVIDRCLLKSPADRMADAESLLADLKALAPTRQLASIGRHDSPFAGLAAFQERDADRFFGRDSDIEAVTDRLQSTALITVAGPSGLGKSSLVRAGVIPALKRAGAGWHVHIARPGRYPMAALAEVVHEFDERASTDSDTAPWADRRVIVDPDATVDMGLEGRLQYEPGYLGARLRAWAARKRRRVLLFIDQFEELFTLGARAGTIRAFVASLASVADDASSPLRVILAVRSDYLDRLAEYRAFMNQVGRGLYFLPPLTRDGIQDALEQPVKAAGYRFENASMVTDMLDQVSNTPGALPLLQFAAAHLWNQRDQSGRLITEDSYRAMGGLAGTLATHADQVMASLSPAERRLARALFERLVTAERTRAVVDMDEVCELGGEPAIMEALVHRLVDVRLLVVERGDGATVELVHESLIHAWPSLVHWLDENREDAHFLQRLRTAARQWHESARDDGILWRGQPALEARLWAERYTGKLGEREGSFLRAVLALANSAVRRRRIVRSGVIAVLAMLLVASVALVRINEAERAARASAAALAVEKQRLKQALEKETEHRKAAEKAIKETDAARKEAEQAKAEAERLRISEQRKAEELERLLEQTRVAERKARRESQRAGAAELNAEELRLAAEATANEERATSKQLEQHLEQQRELLRKHGVKKPTLKE